MKYSFLFSVSTWENFAAAGMAVFLTNIVAMTGELGKYGIKYLRKLYAT